jgi:hypothetical protein
LLVGRENRKVALRILRGVTFFVGRKEREVTAGFPPAVFHPTHRFISEGNVNT